ncbi:EAL domain-containing protein [Hydrogenimonas urashimensis]|uniref:EAL domain-containing protein n=1 Tax=Hydrogenimonas urashimensis TaxID=2740515 RepID=UPI001915842E|nr:EAL domain-containing protein [Hydrogenimonas urashimensis]
MDIEKCDEFSESISIFFIEHKIPFAILIEDMRIIEDEFVNNIFDESKKIYFTDFFKALRNKCGYHFLRHEVKQTKSIERGHFHDKLLYKIHDQWINWLIDAIINERPEEFPLSDAKNCPLLFALDYPESKMICHKLKICDLLKKTHEKLHELTATFTYLFTRRYYKSAYLLFVQLKETHEKLMNLIATLYFNAQINRSQTFKNYLYRKTFDKTELFVAIFDIFSMKKINKIYSNKTGDKVVQLVDECLKSVHLENQSWMLYAKGVSGDFYILFENVSIESIKNVEISFNKILEKKFSGLPMVPEFTVKKAFLKIGEPLIYGKDGSDIVFHYLKERLKEEEATLYLTSDNDQHYMRKWIDEYHWNITKFRKLISEKKVEVFFQPIAYMGKIDKTFAFEALARLQDGDHFIPAGVFIDQIIEMNLITSFDHMVLDRIVFYHDEIHAMTNTLFINVSASTLQDEQYISKLIHAIRGPLIGTEIIIELTEQVLMENLGVIEQLHNNHGLIFAIDDFGTGYSSLQMVIELAEKNVINYLKVDGSLIRNIEDSSSTQRILRIISEMSRSLELETIIEFLETDNQHYMLKSYGINYGQGYYIGRPKMLKKK